MPTSFVYCFTYLFPLYVADCSHESTRSKYHITYGSEGCRFKSCACEADTVSSLSKKLNHQLLRCTVPCHPSHTKDLDLAQEASSKGNSSLCACIGICSTGYDHLFIIDIFHSIVTLPFSESFQNVSKQKWSCTSQIHCMHFDFQLVWLSISLCYPTAFPT